MKYAILLSLLFIGLQHPKQFSLEAISADLPFHSEWETRALTAQQQGEVEKALSQPYAYMTGGGQCFCFASLDDKYVVKFFKQKAFAPPAWMDKFPFPFLIHWLREKKIAKGEAKRSRVFESFRSSFDDLSEETGLIYVHLNKTGHLKKTVSFSDALGKMHEVDMDDLEFAVQRKGKLAPEILDECMQRKDLAGAKEAIDRLLSLHLSLQRKGYRNRDPNFRSNYGFLDSRPFVIDIGRIAPASGEKMKLDKFRLHLSSHHPDLVPHFDQALRGIL